MKTRPLEGTPLSPDRRKLLFGGAAALATIGLGSRSVLHHGAAAARSDPTAGPRAGGELLVAFDATSTATFALDPHNSAFAPMNRVIRSI